jgi:hypothetical protein
MFTPEDLDSLRGQTTVVVEVRGDALRLGLASGFIVAISVADDGTLSVADE